LFDHLFYFVYILYDLLKSQKIFTLALQELQIIE